MALKTVTGDKAILKMLEQAPEHAYAIVRTATTKATTPIMKAIKANAKEIEDTGAYARSIGKRTIATAKFKKRGVVHAAVGPRKGYLETTVDPQGNEIRRGPENYAHLVEWGTRHSAPQLVQTHAFDSTKDTSVNLFLTTVPKALIKRMARDGNKKR